MFTVIVESIGRADSVNPKSTGGALKSAPARGVADAQRKAAKELALGIEPKEGNKATK